MVLKSERNYRRAVSVEMKGWESSNYIVSGLFSFGCF